MIRRMCCIIAPTWTQSYENLFQTTFATLPPSFQTVSGEQVAHIHCTGLGEIRAFNAGRPHHLVEYKRCVLARPPAGESGVRPLRPYHGKYNVGYFVV